jgi:hypothetical protein
MSRCKTPEIPRNEVYIKVRRIDCPAGRRGGMRATPQMDVIHQPAKRFTYE